MAHEQLGVQSHAISTGVTFFRVPPDQASGDAAPDAGRFHAVEDRYLLVTRGAPEAPEGCEDPAATALEVTVLWGENVLEVMHLSPPRPFRIGHGPGVDFTVPPELLSAESVELVSLDAGVPRVVAPGGATLEAANGTSAARTLELRDGAVAVVRFGSLAFHVSSGAAGRRLPRAFGADTSGLGASFAATLGAVATFLGVIAYYTPALGSTLDDELNPERVAILRAYLETNAERETKLDQAPGDGAKRGGGGKPGQAAEGPEGKMGRPDHPARGKRFAIRGTGEVELSRPALVEEAKNFGMIGLLSVMSGRAVPASPWATVPNGPDATDAWGEMFGESLGESAGKGGLGLSGPGFGGGGYGKGIGLVGIGTCGESCGVGTGSFGIGNGEGGYGRGLGRGGGRHVPKAPKIRIGGTEIVNGHIPREVIQRVVRQNYGRFRQCYEHGLRTNPNLTGRVTARFVIGRDGGVTSAVNGGSDLPDSAVVSCVISAFYGITFPSPDGGIVTVSYPLMLVPG